MAMISHFSQRWQSTVIWAAGGRGRIGQLTVMCSPEGCWVGPRIAQLMEDCCSLPSTVTTMSSSLPWTMTPKIFLKKSVIIQEIFTFKGFLSLSPLYHGWMCPKCRPKPALFSFGVSACLIGKVKSCFIQKSIWHCAIHICDQESTDKCTIWGRTACATVQ